MLLVIASSSRRRRFPPSPLSAVVAIATTSTLTATSTAAAAAFLTATTPSLSNPPVSVRAMTMTTTTTTTTAASTASASSAFPALSYLSPSHLPLRDPSLLPVLSSDDESFEGDDGDVENDDNDSSGARASFFDVRDPSASPDEILSGSDLIARVPVMRREDAAKVIYISRTVRVYSSLVRSLFFKRLLPPLLSPITIRRRSIDPRRPFRPGGTVRRR